MSKKDNSNKTKIFSFDIGTASIGWSVVNHPEKDIDENTGEVFDNIEIVASGVRMFNEPLTPKDRKLLNLSRRTNRLSRRRTRRVALRKVAIKKLLLTLGYYKSEDFNHYLDNGEVNYNSVFQRVILENKKEPSHHNIFYLRVKALDHQLTKDELAVVLFNLAKTRGFKSSKKLRPNEDELSQIDKKDTESGAVKKAIENLRNEQIEVKEKYGKDIRTFAELIYFLNSQGKKNSYRNKDSDYSNSILRKDIENEAKLIFAKQREFYKELTEEFEEKFLETMLHQRHIKFNLESVGKCTYLKQEYRASKSCFSSEYYTSIGRLINVRIKLFQGKERELNKQEIHEILNKAQENFGNLTYKQLRKYLGLSEKDSFKGLSYDDETQKSGIYAGDKIEEDKKKYLISFEETKEVDKYLKELLGKGDLSEDNYKTIVNNPKILDQLVQLNSLYNQKDIIKEIEKDENLKNLPQEIKDAIIYCNLSFTKYLQLSLKAIYLMLPYMKEVYKKVEVGGIKTELEDTNNRWESKKVIDKLVEDKVFVKFEPKTYDKLPSIFEIEKKGDFYIPNHAVIKRALSQIIKTFNAMVSKYGKPNLVNIELLRELKNPSAKKEQISKREDNTIERESAREELKQSGLEDSEANILKIRLWKEQSHSCPYCQNNISKSDLENENATQIDHIIPESKSFDNSYNNKVLVCTKCNQDKLQRTPFLWLKDDNVKWKNFESWVYSSSLSKYKKDKLQNRQNLDEITQGFVNRQLNDSAYITILIKDFIDGYFKFPEDGKKRHVYATKGGLTSILRDIFSLKKYRDYKALEQDKGYYLYNNIVWKNPEVAEQLNVIQNQIKQAKKDINDAKKKGEKESEQVVKTLASLTKKFEEIKKGFVEYLPAYFSSASILEEKEEDDIEESSKQSNKRSKKVEPPSSIKAYISIPSFSDYLIDLKLKNTFAKDFEKMEKNFIGDKHHAMDAILIGLITPSIVQGVGTLANQSDDIIKELVKNEEDIKEKNKRLKLLYNGRINQKIIFLLNNSNKIEELQKKGILKINKLVGKIMLLKGLKDEIWKSLDKIFISRQPNRKVSGRIHEDTIYSAKETKKVEDKGKLKLTKRKNVSDLSIEEINNKVVATPALKEVLIDWINNKDENKPKFPTMPTNNGQQGHIIRKVTVITGDTGEGFYKVRGGLVVSSETIRLDIFSDIIKDKKGNDITKYAFLPITYGDIYINKQIPSNDKIRGDKDFIKFIKENSIKPKFSISKKDLVFYKLNEKDKGEFMYLNRISNENIILEDHLGKETIQKSINQFFDLKKAEVDLLGNVSIVKNNIYEDFSSLINKINNKKK